MGNKKFQEAFSVVRASDELRLEVLQMTEKTNRSSSTLRRVLIIAAIIALLATTALAAPTIINALKGGKTVINNTFGVQGKLSWLPGSDKQYNDYDVFLDLDLNSDAPDDVLIHYLPEIPEGYEQTLGFKSDIERTYLWATDEDGTNYMHPNEIQFMQWPGGFWNERKVQGIEWACWIVVPEGEEPQADMTEMGGKIGYLVETEYGYGARIFFWSDGDYVFKLEVPDEFTDEQLAALIESVHIVENITPYIFNE